MPIAPTANSAMAIGMRSAIIASSTTNIKMASSVPLTSRAFQNFSKGDPGEKGEAERADHMQPPGFHGQEHGFVAGFELVEAADDNPPQ